MSFPIDIPNPSKLEHCYDIQPLADLLQIDRSKLLRFLYSEYKLYRYFEVPKKMGGTRLIKTPVEPLKALQLKVKAELEKYYEPRAATHGFVKQRSITTNATPHLRKRYVLNLDLEDFFGTITFGRVKRAFQASPFNMPHNVATVVAQICCEKGVLPQGAPTSPIVSNIIAFKLDNQLMSLARQYRCTYTRYADDITFSFNQNQNSLPRAIVDFKYDRVVIGSKLADLISKNGFKVNFDKTRLQSRQTRQSVTNITVNEKLNVNRRFLRQTSSMIYAAIKFGFPNAEAEYFNRFHRGYIPARHMRKRQEKPGDLFRLKIRGRLNFIRNVRGKTCPVWRRLMYDFTVAIGEPKDIYKLNFIDLIAQSTFVLHNNIDKSSGSGFLLKGVGLVTNQHVLEGYDDSNIDDCYLIEWLVNPKQNFIGLQLPVIDKKADIAIVQSELLFNTVKPLEPAVSPNYEQGTKVILIGYPNYSPGDKPTVIKTEISGSYHISDLKRIRVREIIVKGMSGGVAINEDGQVIGVISDGLDNRQGNYTSLPCGFVPINRVFELLSDPTKNE